MVFLLRQVLRQGLLGGLAMQKRSSIMLLLGLLMLAGNASEVHARNPTSVVTATQNNPPAPPPNSVLPAPSTGSIEQTVFQQINEYRLRKGLSALRWDAQLAERARVHSKEMADKLIPMGHQGFEDRVKSTVKIAVKKLSYVGYQSIENSDFEERIKSAAKTFSFKAAAENVAYNMGYDDPAAKALQGWLASSGHRHNIEGQYSATGVGVSENNRGEYYFTQIFIRR
jgi:uncharacterized protein YkwD